MLSNDVMCYMGNYIREFVFEEEHPRLENVMFCDFKNCSAIHEIFFVEIELVAQTRGT